MSTSAASVPRHSLPLTVPHSRGTAEERKRRCRGMVSQQGNATFVFAGSRAPLALYVRLSPLKGGLTTQNSQLKTHNALPMHGISSTTLGSVLAQGSWPKARMSVPLSRGTAEERSDDAGGMQPPEDVPRSCSQAHVPPWLTAFACPPQGRTQNSEPTTQDSLHGDGSTGGILHGSGSVRDDWGR